MECAEKIEALEEKQSGYKQRKNRLSDMEYHKIERMEEEIQEGYGKLKKAEEYQEFIKRDLRKLDGEKHAYHFRRSELRRIIADTRSMTIVCTVAVILGIVVLFVLQYGFHINTKLGYLAVAAVGAVAITLIFIKHNDSRCGIVLCVPYVDIAIAGKLLRESRISLGAQNLHWEDHI